MISDIDLCRAAKIMVKRYGDGTATEAAMCADEFLDQGNLDGKRWRNAEMALRWGVSHTETR